MKSFMVALFAASLVVVFLALSPTRSAQAAPPAGAHAVWKTFIPSLAAPTNPGATASPSGSALSSGVVAPAVSFTLNPYSPPVPVIVTPTTTSPEAEEEIAADPGNYQNLLSAISDFSFFQNITKYAYSTNDGSA